MDLKTRLETGTFAVLAEMDPPKGADPSEMKAHALRVKGAVDAFLVPEMGNAVMRMSALGGSMILQSDGMETVMQVNCRDRNRLALQADLLAADACGIHNIMAVTGEPPNFGDHPNAKPVYDIELLDLLKTAQRMTHGKDMAGIDLSGAPDFFLGSSANTGLHDQALENEVAAATAKIEAGARFLVTPPVFDTDAMETFFRRLRGAPCKMLPTVLLLKSVGMARYIQRNMPHIAISEETIRRIQKSAD